MLLQVTVTSWKLFEKGDIGATSGKNVSGGPKQIMKKHEISDERRHSQIYPVTWR